MSIFSGKCDFYDGFVAIHCNGDENEVEKELKNTKLYVRGRDGRDHLVKSDTIKDIAKYYPYLESIMVCSKETGRTTILCSDSFIDQEERERLNWYINDVMKYWRKCKRNKVPFIVEECVKKLNFMSSDIISIIAERVAKDGKNAEFDDIHLPMHEYFRRRWFEELVRLGYTEQEAYIWCFKGLFDSDDIIKARLGRPLKNEVQQ